MCGFIGFLDRQGGKTQAELVHTIEQMTAMISHRGPDSKGVWCDENIGLAIGHQRLSIIDLTDAGHQPMISASERFVIAYNGEIYNAVELREELTAIGVKFRGGADTEVLLEACAAFGVLAACQRLNGMFAFVLWDRQENTLSLVRDRLGKKPLYWGFNQEILFFGSQLKSFVTHPNWQSEIDKEALDLYFRFNYVPSPYSIFKDIHKLNPGSIITINRLGESQETYYWNIRNVVEEAVEKRNPKYIETELVEELDILLGDAVKRRMIADVPLGAFLSGGIDSSTVVALMQKQSSQSIKTFSVGFYEKNYNEAKEAALVAKHLGTNHHELYLEVDEVRKVIPDIPEWCDEPFADVSQIPTFLVSQLARQHVAVALSGDGGDELFAGYNRYRVGRSLWPWMRRIPQWARSAGSYGIQRFSPRTWDKLVKGMSMFEGKQRLLGDKFYKFSEVLKATNQDQFYRLLISQWDPPASLVLGNHNLSEHYWKELEKSTLSDFVEKMQLMDTLSYLPDDILTKVDRASMAVSLEARVPLLDHRVVEFAWQLPMDMKIRQGQGKWLLRQVLNRYVPRHLTERPKMGFAVPIDSWLRGPLREWAEHLLSEERLKNEGILNPIPIRQKWQEHLSGRYNWQYPLWGVLMFQAWKERWVW